MKREALIRLLLEMRDDLFRVIGALQRHEDAVAADELERAGDRVQDAARELRKP